MLTINIDSIRDEELDLGGQLDPSDLVGLDDLLSTAQMIVTGPVSYRFKIYRVSGMIEVQGYVATQVTLSCSRCLEPFTWQIESDFELTYAEQLPEVEDESEEEIELTAEEMGISLLEGEQIDLTDPLVEQLLLSLPFQPLCEDDCKGLCPICGADKNKEHCHCVQPQFDTRFAELKKIKIDSDK